MAHSCEQLTLELHTKLLREPSSLDIAQILFKTIPWKPQSTTSKEVFFFFVEIKSAVVFSGLDGEGINEEKELFTH
jgi:hypothetical protein